MTRKKKTTARKRTKRSTPSLAAALDRIQKELPPNLRRLVTQVRRGVRDLEKQIEKQRVERERRWEKQQTDFRRDLAKALKRLEKAVAPTTPQGPFPSPDSGPTSMAS
jgi:siroheme synthase (precorrin-2 oxidase/ferrochelatase)